ncbi:MAG: hypothetical protein OXE46_00795 [Chloroflexi bacterium]|nr:hypothetical protein [Chloroflexota bacterium]
MISKIADTPGGVLLFAAAGLLMFFGLRLHQLDAIPLFIDEAIAVERADDVLNGIYLRHASHGKFLQPYLYLLFQVQQGAWFVARAVALLLTCLGMAAGLAIARCYGGFQAVALAVALLSLSPMLFFFQRLSLADTFLSATLLLWLWSLLRFYKRDEPSLPAMAVCAALFILSLLVKASALFLLPLTLVLALLLPRWSMTVRARALAGLYLGMFVLWLPFALALASRGLDYFGQFHNLGAATAHSLLDASRIAANLRSMLEGLLSYHGAPFIVCLLAVLLFAIWLRSRIMLSLLAAGIGFGLAQILLGGARFFRYFLPMLPFLFLAASIALPALNEVAANRNRRGLLPIAWALLCLWAVTFAVPSLHKLYTDPAAAALPSGDRTAYFETDSAGFGIPELVELLDDLAVDAAVDVEGAFSNCASLRLYVAHTERVRVHCPNVLASERRAKYLNDHLLEQAALHQSYYIVLEARTVVNLARLTAVDLIPVAEFARPGGKSALMLYRIE